MDAPDEQQAADFGLKTEEAMRAYLKVYNRALAKRRHGSKEPLPGTHEQQAALQGWLRDQRGPMPSGPGSKPGRPRTVKHDPGKKRGRCVECRKQRGDAPYKTSAEAGAKRGAGGTPRREHELAKGAHKVMAADTVTVHAEKPPSSIGGFSRAAVVRMTVDQIHWVAECPLSAEELARGYDSSPYDAHEDISAARRKLSEIAELNLERGDTGSTGANQSGEAAADS